MILVDWQIGKYIAKGKIGVEPFSPFSIQPNSLDVCLNSDFIEYMDGEVFDTMNKSSFSRGIIEHRNVNSFILHPNQFVLAETKEKITLPRNVVAQIEGKSSLARLGLTIHQTGGWIDAGFSGTITLELHNESNRVIVLYPDMSIAQVVFHKTKRCKRPYGDGRSSHYQNQQGVTISRYDG